MSQKPLPEKDNVAEIFEAQDQQYMFPYHHIPSFQKDGSVSRIRDLDWGFDYMACLYHAKKTIEGFKPSSILEVGCGDGAIIGAMDSAIARRVGVDLSEKAIPFAKAFFPQVEFSMLDASSMQEQFDAVMAIEVLEHIPDDGIHSFLQTLAARTKSGGHIYISVPSVNLPLYKKHYRHYDPALLKKQIEEAGIEADIVSVDFFRSPVSFEKTYMRLTNNRLFCGEIHPLRRMIW
ncbi:MAG: class I SAM-dependent methyltransferase, partial [Alphaproteobacteria bacterium]|nr:class I SAM-dependent methyltransferase [Alphaproteobacteria bacterium]